VININGEIKVFRLIIVFLLMFSGVAYSAQMGPLVPTQLISEGNVLHVHMDGAYKTGLPECAYRSYIDITTDAGKVKASIVMAAFMGGKKITLYMRDGIDRCDWGSSVPNDRHLHVKH